MTEIMLKKYHILEGRRLFSNGLIWQRHNFNLMMLIHILLMLKLNRECMQLFVFSIACNIVKLFIRQICISKSGSWIEPRNGVKGIYLRAAVHPNKISLFRKRSSALDLIAGGLTDVDILRWSLSNDPMSYVPEFLVNFYVFICDLGYPC